MQRELEEKARQVEITKLHMQLDGKARREAKEKKRESVTR